MPGWIEPMLAASGEGRLPDSPEIVFEYKYDGYRCLAFRAADGTVMLKSRLGNDVTDEFHTVATALATILTGRIVVLDGELVALASGRPDFGLMQERRGRYRTYQRLRGRPEPFGDGMVHYMVFDLLRLDDTMVLTHAYEDRRRLLEQLVPDSSGVVRLAPSFPRTQLDALGLSPRDLLDRAAAAGYEGLIACAQPVNDRLAIPTPPAGK